MSTVNLFIRQDNDPLQIRREISWNTLSFDDMGYLIRHGFISVINVFTSILQWLIVALFGYSPLWILIGIGVFVWWRLKKRPGGAKPLFKKAKEAGAGTQTGAQTGAQAETGEDKDNP
jgi:hypothetical protein